MARAFRYTFILVLVALSTCLAAFGGWRFARASAPVNGPIILISIDALRADRLPAYGYTNVRTPAIDALAADGVVFERAYSHIPQTLPAHAALLTGRLPFETGVRDNVGFTIKSSERLLAEMLRDRGFSTGRRRVVLPAAEGDRHRPGIHLLRCRPACAPTANRRPMRCIATAPRPNRSPSGGSNRVGTDRAFLFLHLDEPRAAVGGAPRTGSPIETAYDAAIARVDEVVGRLVRYLKAHQLYDRSTIILLSDHGEGLGDHGEQAHGLFLYDEALHVPLIVKQPAGEGAGRRVAAVVRTWISCRRFSTSRRRRFPADLRGRSLKGLIEATPMPRQLDSRTRSRCMVRTISAGASFGASPTAASATSLRLARSSTISSPTPASARTWRRRGPTRLRR